MTFEITSSPSRLEPDKVNVLMVADNIDSLRMALGLLDSLWANMEFPQPTPLPDGRFAVLGRVWSARV